MANQKITVDLIARTRQYTQGMKRAGRSTRGLLNEMSNSEKVGTRMFGNLGKAATGFGLAFVGAASVAAVGAIKAFADFDSKMNESVAIMGDVSDAMRSEMAGAAREVALTTKFSAEEAAESYFFLASAGLDAAASMEALPQVAAFAQAGMFDMATATDLATDAQSALGLASKDPQQNLKNLTKVTDVLVKANTLANASVQQFSEALTNKAGAALRILNKDVTEGVAVLAVFADQGLKGAAAGEALSIILRDLQKAALENADEFERLNISVFDSEGNMRNVADVIADVEDATRGMSDATRKQTLADLGFQERSVQNIIALLGTSEAIRNYESNLQSAAGTTGDIADKQMQTLSEQLGLLKDKMTDVGIGIGETTAPIIQDMMPALEVVIEGFGALAADILPAVIGGFETLARGALEMAGWFNVGANATADLLDVLAAMRDGAFSIPDDPATNLANAMVELEGRAALTEKAFLKLVDVTGANAKETIIAAKATREWILANEEGVAVDELNRWIREQEVALIDQAAAALLSGEATRDEIEAQYNASYAAAAVEEARRLELAAHYESINAAREATAAGEEETEALGDTTEEVEGLAGALGEAAANQTSLANAMREFADPAFKAVSSLQRLKTAQEAVDEIVKEGKGGTEEFAAAMLDLAEANLETQAALDEFEGTGVEEQIRVIADALGIGDMQAQSLLETLGVLDGQTVSMVIDVEERVRIATGGSRVGDKETTAAIDAMAAIFGDLPTRQHGGHLAAGQTALVGEVGPELFVPNRAGTILPTGTFGGGLSVTVNNPTTRNLDRDLQVGLLTAQTAGLVEVF